MLWTVLGSSMTVNAQIPIAHWLMIALAFAAVLYLYRHRGATKGD